MKEVKILGFNRPTSQIYHSGQVAQVSDLIKYITMKAKLTVDFRLRGIF